MDRTRPSLPSSQEPDQSLSATVPAEPSEALPGVDLTGRTLGDFTIVHRLGQGGMGQVYLAKQISLQRQVALKILKAELASNDTALKRFRAEAMAVARATHVNIIQVYAVSEQDGMHYMALEYVEGHNLHEHLAKHGLPDLPLALSIMRQTASALARAGELGITHRDIKPENILLTRKGEIKVADFGLSRSEQQPLNLTQTGVAMGTPLYMSPEQVQGQNVDPRSDIYSFGVTCYHMLAGRPPFRGETAFEVAVQHVQSQPQPLRALRPGLPVELCAIVDKMMAKNPEDRYQTGQDLLQDLARLQNGGSARGNDFQGNAHADRPTEIVAVGPHPLTLPVARGAPPQGAPRATGWARGRRWLTALVLLAVLAGGARLGWRLIQAWRRPVAVPLVEDVPTVAPPPRIVSDKEKLLRAEVEKFTHPRNRLEQLAGLEHRLELGLYYLEDWQAGHKQTLAEADRFFTELSTNESVRTYNILGRLGKAMVLSFQDRPAESNELFLKLHIEKLPLADYAARDSLLYKDKRLQPWIVRALKQNEARATSQEPFPRPLKNFLKPGLELPPRPKNGPIPKFNEKSSQISFPRSAWERTVLRRSASPQALSRG